MPIPDVLGFLRIPLKTAALLVIVVFSVLLLVAIKAGLLGIWLGLLLLTGLFNYTFILFDSVLDGETEPPVLAIEMMNLANAPRPLLLLAVVLAVFFASRAATYWIGPFAAVLAAVLFVGLLPAMLAVQAVTGMTWQAVNLATSARLIRRLGSDYFNVIGFVAAASLLGSWCLSIDALPLVVRIAIVLYLWLAAFCLLAGVVRARADDLGLDDAWTPVADEDRAPPDEDRARTRFVDRVYAEWRGGAHANAWSSVSERVGQAPDALHELEALYEAVSRWPDPRLANRLARELLPMLLAAKRTGEAVDLVRERLRFDKDFRPASSAELLQLVALARDAGDRPTARALLRDFQRLFPHDPAQSHAVLLSRQLER